MPLSSSYFLLGLATLWLPFVVLAVWAGRRRRRWLRRIGIAGSLVTFVPVWLGVGRAVGELFGMPISESLGTGTSFFVTTFGLGTSWVICGITLATAGLVGIASVWAALGRSYWFLRVSAVGGLLAIALLVPAYEPWLLYLTQSVVAIVPLLSARRLPGWRLGANRASLAEETVGRRGLQFGLRDLLLFMLLAAAVLAVFASAPKGTWTGDASPDAAVPAWILLTYSPLLGIVFGLTTLAAAWVVFGHSPWWARVMGFLVALPVLPCLIWLAIWQQCARRDSRSLGSRLARAGLVLYSLLSVLPMAVIYWRLVFPPPIPDVALPKPNGYDMLQAAAKPLENVTIPETPSACVGFVATYRKTLDEVHAALDQPSRVPIRYSADSLDLDRFHLMRQLARALRAEALAVTSENRPDDAIRYYGDILRLAQVTGRGGLLVDELVAIAIAGIGFEGLDEQVSSLDAAQCRSVIPMLAAHDHSFEPIEDVVQRDLAWGVHVYGWFGHLVWLAEQITGALGLDSEWATSQRAIGSAFKRHQAELRIVMTKLALRAYRLEHHTLPDGLVDLVPKYLPAVPIDPLSGGPLVYKNTGQNYQVQSPGLDRYLKDQGG